MRRDQVAAQNQGERELAAVQDGRPPVLEVWDWQTALGEAVEAARDQYQLQAVVKYMTWQRGISDQLTIKST